MLVTKNDTFDALAMATAQPDFAPREEPAEVKFWDQYERSRNLFEATSLSSSYRNNLMDAYSDEQARIYKETGEIIPNPVYRNPANTESEMWNVTLPDYDKRADEIEAKFPGVKVQRGEDIKAAIRDRAQALEASERQGVGSGAARFMGMAVGSLKDPMNIAATIATLPFGGGGGVAVGAGVRAVATSALSTGLKLGAINMAAGVASESLVQAVAAPYQESLGIESHPLEHIAAAGIGGGVLGFGLGGVGSLVGHGVRAIRAGRAGAVDVPERFSGSLEDQIRAALDLEASGEFKLPPAVKELLSSDGPPSLETLVAAHHEMVNSGVNFSSEINTAAAVIEDAAIVTRANPHPDVPGSAALNEDIINATVKAINEGDFAEVNRLVQEMERMGGRADSAEPVAPGAATDAPTSPVIEAHAGGEPPVPNRPNEAEAPPLLEDQSLTGAADPELVAARRAAQDETLTLEVGTPIEEGGGGTSVVSAKEYLISLERAMKAVDSVRACALGG